MKAEPRTTTLEKFSETYGQTESQAGTQRCRTGWEPGESPLLDKLLKVKVRPRRVRSGYFSHSR